jgi:CRP-like cAMP-binding protein
MRMLGLRAVLDFVKENQALELFLYLERVLVVLHSNTVFEIKQLVFFLWLAHFNACMQYFVATLEGLPDDSWVVRGELLTIVSFPQRYSTCFVHALGQMLAVSQGIVEPLRTSENVMYSMSIILGICCVIHVVSTITNKKGEYSGNGGAKRAYHERLSALESWMNFAELSPGLRSRLRVYFTLYYPNHQYHDEQGLLAALSPPLQEQVALARCERLLRALNILRTHEDLYMAGTVANALRREVFMHLDYIVHEGRPTVGMYFINHGNVEILRFKRKDDLAEVSDLADPSQLVTDANDPTRLVRIRLANRTRGEFFGEMALLEAHGLATASVRAVDFCETLLLARTDFNQICVSHPEFREHVLNVAYARGWKQDLQHEAGYEFDVFISHAWDKDELDRSVHKRAQVLAEQLSKRGIKPWIDGDQMSPGDINVQMTRGVDDSSVMLVLVTRAYIDKVAGRGKKGADESCKQEFDCARLETE